MINMPSIELEDDEDRDYMVLCYDGQRLDLEEFFYHPKNLYQLTHQATKEKKLLWVIGYEMPPLGIAKDDVQVNLLLRVVKNVRGKLMASSETTAYDFPACLDDILSPDDWTIERLNSKVTFPRVEKKPNLLLIHQQVTKPPIDLSRTTLGQTSKAIPAQIPDVISAVEERSQPEPSTPNIFLVRRHDTQRVNRILLKWVELSSANPADSAWSMVPNSSFEFNVVRKDKTIFSFDSDTRQLTSSLSLERLKNEIESMATDALKSHPESLDSHELARHLFLRSVSFSEDSFSGFWLHLLSLKKEGNHSKYNLTIRRTRRMAED